LIAHELPIVLNPFRASESFEVKEEFRATIPDAHEKLMPSIDTLNDRGHKLKHLHGTGRQALE
jgi:hypothetical protein